MRTSSTQALRHAAVLCLAGLAAGGAVAQADTGAGAPAAAISPGPMHGAAPRDKDREPVLVRMVRQDCGSCHGMRLTGGLGPALTREALADKPVEALAATIFHGRPGTPMPPWRALLSEADALWIAQQLAQGFPEEPARGRR
jgi:cytochrome c55X